MIALDDADVMLAGGSDSDLAPSALPASPGPGAFHQFNDQPEKASRPL
jgi:3-oxoacyl-[acyl-carrier-protein] synthase II